MIGNIFKLIAALILGYVLGWIMGAMFGVILGALPSLFFREIVASNLVIPMSITLSLLSGGILGFLAIQMSNKIFTASDKPSLGIAIGIVIGFIVVLFVDGVLDPSDTVMANTSSYSLSLIYTGMVGSDIGRITFPILGAIRVVRDIVESRKEAEKSNERLKEIRSAINALSSKDEKRS